MKMKKQISLFIGLLFAPLLKVVAQVNTDLIGSAAGSAGISTAATIPGTIGSIIKLVLSFVGTIFFVFIIYSGLQWMTAGGESDKIDKAKTRIINASIGLAITAAAYFVTWFISKLMTGGL